MIYISFYLLKKKFDAGVPISAACELIFSVGQDAFSAKRNWLSDKNFERLLLYFVNKWFCPGLAAILQTTFLQG